MAPPNDERLGRRHQTISRFSRNRIGIVGLSIVVAAVGIAILAPLIAPYDPLQQDLPNRFAGIGSEHHLLGTDAFGQDMLSRLMWGGRISLSVGFFAGAISICIGAPIGMIAGFRGGRVDTIVMRLVDVMLAFPYLLLAIVIVGALGSGLRNTIIAIVVANIPFTIRVMRGVLLTIRHEQFIEAARTVGASDLHILRTAILPSILPFVIVSFTVSTGLADPRRSWAVFPWPWCAAPEPRMGCDAGGIPTKYLPIAPHAVLLPGIVLMIVAVGLNLAGDALRDAMDVTLSE